MLRRQLNRVKSNSQKMVVSSKGSVESKKVIKIENTYDISGIARDCRNKIYRLATKSVQDLETCTGFGINSDDDRQTQSDYVDLLYGEEKKEEFFESLASKFIKEYAERSH